MTPYHFKNDDAWREAFARMMANSDHGQDLSVRTPNVPRPLQQKQIVRASYTRPHVYAARVKVTP